MGLVGVLHPLCFRKAVIGGPAWVPESSRKEMRLLLVLLGVLLGAPGAPALSFEASEETEHTNSLQTEVQNQMASMGNSDQRSKNLY